MSSSKPPRHVLRSILRRLKTNVKLVGGTDTSRHTREFVMHQSRSNNSPELHKFGGYYQKLLDDLKERKRLLDLDTGAEQVLTPKELSRRAAARAGLQLPELDPDLDDYSSKS